MQHQAGEGQEVQTRQGRCQPFVVAGEAAEARSPGETALGHPMAHMNRYAALA